MQASQKTPRQDKPVIWYLMASGRTVDLMNMKPADIYWPDMVESLVKLPRFNGATGQVTYTVAQHCCLAYDYADPRWKKIALLNDFYKALLGEQTRSGTAFLAALADDPRHFMDIVRLAKDELSGPIFDAAGIGPFSSQDEFHKEQAYLRWLDDALLATEKRDLMIELPGAPDWKLPDPFKTTIKAWGQDRAREELTKRLALIGIDGRG